MYTLPDDDYRLKHALHACGFNKRVFAIMRAVRAARNEAVAGGAEAKAPVTFEVQIEEDHVVRGALTPSGWDVVNARRNGLDPATKEPAWLAVQLIQGSEPVGYMPGVSPRRRSRRVPPFSVTMDPENHAWLRSLAKANNTSFSDMLDRVVEQVRKAAS